MGRQLPSLPGGRTEAQFRSEPRSPLPVGGLMVPQDRRPVSICHEKAVSATSDAQPLLSAAINTSFYLSLPQDVVCALLLSLNCYPPPNSLSQNILSAPTYNHKPKQRGSRCREICAAALWMPASRQIICLQIVSDTGSPGFHHLPCIQVCFSNTIKTKKTDVLSLPLSGFNLSQALLQGSLLLARELDLSVSCTRE